MTSYIYTASTKTMTEVAKYSEVNGDAINSPGSDMKLIIHCCNDKKMWNTEFALSLSSKWPQTKIVYEISKSIMGSITAIKVNIDTIVVNMFVYDDISNSNLKYDALAVALTKVRDLALKHEATVHCQKFGTGDDWCIIKQMIMNNVVSDGVSVSVYHQLPTVN